MFICVWFNQAKTTELILMKFCTEIPYIPGMT